MGIYDKWHLYVLVQMFACCFNPFINTEQFSDLESQIRELQEAINKLQTEHHGLHKKVDDTAWMMTWHVTGVLHLDPRDHNHELNMCNMKVESPFCTPVVRRNALSPVWTDHSLWCDSPMTGESTLSTDKFEREKPAKLELGKPEISVLQVA